MCLNNEGDINNVSRKFIVMCRIQVVYYLKRLLKFCKTSGVYPNTLKIYRIKPIIINIVYGINNYLAGSSTRR